MGQNDQPRHGVVFVTAFLVRLGLGGIGLKGWLWLGTAMIGLAFIVWLAAKLYMAGVYAERIKGYEAAIAAIEAKLKANEEITKDAQADATASEEREQKLKELIDALRNDKSCPLSKEHIKGVRKIDESQ